MNKSVSELRVSDILKINANKPIVLQLDAFINYVSCKISNLDKRIECLETENIKKDENNNTLKVVITTMQKCINKSDRDIRNKNDIISGVPEQTIILQNGEFRHGY